MAGAGPEAGVGAADDDGVVLARSRESCPGAELAFRVNRLSRADMPRAAEVSFPCPTDGPALPLPSPGLAVCELDEPAALVDAAGCMLFAVDGPARLPTRRVRPRLAVARAARGTAPAGRFSVIGFAGLVRRACAAVELSAAMEEEDACAVEEVVCAVATGVTDFAAFLAAAALRFSSSSRTRRFIMPFPRSTSPRFFPASRLWESENISRAWWTARRRVCGEERVYAVISCDVGRRDVRRVEGAAVEAGVGVEGWFTSFVDADAC